MSNDDPKTSFPVAFAECVEFTIPKFDTHPSLTLKWNKIAESERRLIEAKTVNGGTYSELEYTFNEGYREARKHLSTIGYEIAKTEKKIRQVKSECILDKYPDFLKERKLKDNSANREAYLEKQEDYTNAMDRLAMLKALESLLEGKIKVFENVCRYMKVQMNLEIRSGVSSNKYITENNRGEYE